ncbi:MAG: hypothetical protein K2J80_07935 [Oscillospiraceae bacterium]|nr:hypothetical protein [Oscillospiraceae bacterium]
MLTGGISDDDIVFVVTLLMGTPDDTVGNDMGGTDDETALPGSEVCGDEITAEELCDGELCTDELCAVDELFSAELCFCASISDEVSG